MPRNSHSHSNRRVPRTVRLDEQFREEISKLLMKGLQDPRVGFVTISGVEIKNALSYAKVFVWAAQFGGIYSHLFRQSAEDSQNSALNFCPRRKSRSRDAH